MNLEKRFFGIPLIVYMICGITAVLVFLTTGVLILNSNNELKKVVEERTKVIQPLTSKISPVILSPMASPSAVETATVTLKPTRYNRPLPTATPVEPTISQ